MKLNFNFLIKDLDGKPIAGANCGKIIAQNLVNATKGDALKYFGWAMRLNAGDAIDLDKSDQETLRSFIEHHETLPILTKAQAIEYIMGESDYGKHGTTAIKR